MLMAGNFEILTAAEIALMAACVVGFALVSASASRYAITMPMVFVALGALTDGFGLVELDLATEGVTLVGEVTFGCHIMPANMATGLAR